MLVRTVAHPNGHQTVELAAPRLVHIRKAATLAPFYGDGKG